MSLPVEVRRYDGVAGVYASKPFAAGEVVLRLDGRPAGRPSRYSIQVGPAAHLLPDEDGIAQPWRFLNHSCAPNLAVDVPRGVFVALRPITAGDELTFDYNTTEWELAEPFACRCGAASCHGTVRGFRHLSPERRAALQHVAPHLEALVRDGVAGGTSGDTPDS